MSTDRKLGLNRLISISTISLLLLSPYFSHSHKVSLSSLSLSVCLSLSSLSHTIFLSLPSTLSLSPSLYLSLSISLHPSFRFASKPISNLVYDTSNKSHRFVYFHLQIKWRVAKSSLFLPNVSCTLQSRNEEISINSTSKSIYQ